MSGISITALLAAGAIREDDEVLGILQGLSHEQARGVAIWLALATQGPVQLRHMNLDDVREIELTYEQALATMAR